MKCGDKEFYSYYDDVNKELTKEDFVIWQRSRIQNDDVKVKAFMCRYNDADATSIRLYERLREFLCYQKRNSKVITGNIEINEVQDTEIIVGIDGVNKPYRLGADYIGPSSSISCSMDISGEDIYENVRKARTFGGHMIWPRNGRGYDSVNTARAWAYKERIDLTLFALKMWYSHNSRKSKIDWALNKSCDWFNLFQNKKDEGFRNFINFFMLKSFVDKDYNVYNLTSYCEDNNGDDKKFPCVINQEDETVPTAMTKEIFIKYVKGNLFCIENRNKEISTIIDIYK